MSAQPDFFDTTRLSPSELRDATAVARDQNAKVLAIFRRMRRPLSPSQVWRIGCDEGEAWPLTSVRPVHDRHDQWRRAGLGEAGNAV